MSRPLALLINGSPRKSGVLGDMLDLSARELQHKGCEVKIVHIVDLNVRPCTACMQCRTKGRCVLPSDDGPSLLADIRSARIIIVASPCYWGNMSGALKLVFDRLVYGLIDTTRPIPRPLLVGRRALILTACTTPWPFNILLRQSSAVISSVRHILKSAGIRVKGGIVQSGTSRHHHPTRSTQRAISRHCRKLASWALREERG